MGPWRYLPELTEIRDNHNLESRQNLVPKILLRVSIVFSHKKASSMTQ